MVFNCFQCFLSLNFHTSTEIYQAQIASFFLYMAILESKSTYRNRCFLKSRIFKLNQCFYGCLVIQVITHFLITLNKHPNIRCKESAVTTLFCHLRSMNDKRRKEIALIICIVIFNKLIQLQIHIRRTHIRRICHNHIIFLCQCFRHLYQRQ